MKRTTSVLFPIAAIAALALSGCAGGGPTNNAGDGYSGGKIVLGVLTDLTGPYSSLTGENNVRAVQMAVDEFTADNPDIEVEVQKADTKNDPAVANTAAQRMYSQGVDVILDVPNSAAALAVSKVAESSKKLFIAVSSTPTALITTDCNPYSYLWGVTASTYGRIVGTYMTENGGNTWYVPYPDYTFGADYAAGIKEAVTAAGGEILAMDPTPFPTENYSSVMLKAKSLNPDVLMLIQGGADLANAVAAYDQFGLADAGISLGIGNLAQSDIDSIGSDVLAGATSAINFYWNRDDASRAFSTAFEKVSDGVIPNNYNAGAYSAATQYLAAAKRAGSDGADKVREELDGTKFTDVFSQNGEVRAADHAVTKDMFITRAKTPDEITIENDSMEIVETVPSADAWAPPASTCKM